MHKERVYNSGMELHIPSVGKQIAEARLRKGYSQDDLAKLVQVSSYNIQCVENDKAVPVRGLIIKIQKVLECEIVMDGPFGPTNLAMKH